MSDPVQDRMRLTTLGNGCNPTPLLYLGPVATGGTAARPQGARPGQTGGGASLMHVPTGGSTPAL